MAEQSGFFNANVVNGEYDRVYLAEQFAKYFASFIGNGIFGGKSNELMVSESSTTGMKVEVLSGMGWINGYWYENTGNHSLSIAIADGVLNRIDSIVLRWDKVLRNIQLAVKKGEFAGEPSAPAVQRDADVYELKIAEVSVKAGAVSLTQADIRDTRLDSNVCGFVVGVIQQFDTTEFGKQLDSFISNYSAEYKDYIDELKDSATASAIEYKAFLEGLELNGVKELNALFDRLNALIEDESAFATLALKVDDVASEVALANQTLGYSKKNLNVYPYYEKSKTYNGIIWTDNGDGTVTVDGTATNQVIFTFNKYLPLRPGKYVINCGVETAYQTYFTYIIKVEKNNPENRQIVNGDYSNTYFEVTKQDIENYWYEFAATVMKGVTISNITFKPMLRRAEILDSTWEPYRLSVDELISTPNKPGVEYLLAEKWDGKDAYQKTFYVSTLPNKSVVGLETDTQWDKVISINAYALDSDDLTYYPFPVILQGQVTPIAVINKVESGGSLVITTTEDASYLKAYVTVKYTK